jgi:hypothetical protein
MPDAMTMRHIGKPRFAWLVAPLFRLPRILNPRMIIDMPRKTKPDSALSIGQWRAKYFVKMLISETMRKRPIVLVMK